MGCVHSGLNVWHAKYGSPYDFFTELLPYKATFEALHLTETDIGKFYLLFLEIDVDGSMSVDLSEVFNHLRIEKTYFNRRVFGLLDVDNSGSLNFKEFVVGLWNYCTLTDALFERFAFDLYDKDDSGTIDLEEAQHMVKDIYGVRFETNPRAKLAYSKLKELDLFSISFRTFSNFVHKHQAMLYPAFTLQLNLIKYIMGKKFWAKQAANRVKLSRGQYRSIIDIIEKGTEEGIHYNPQLVPAVRAKSKKCKSKSNLCRATKTTSRYGQMSAAIQAAAAYVSSTSIKWRNKNRDHTNDMVGDDNQSNNMSTDIFSKDGNGERSQGRNMTKLSADQYRDKLRQKTALISFPMDSMESNDGISPTNKVSTEKFSNRRASRGRSMSKLPVEQHREKLRQKSSTKNSFRMNSMESENDTSAITVKPNNSGRRASRGRSMSVLPVEQRREKLRQKSFAKKSFRMNSMESDNGIISSAISPTSTLSVEPASMYVTDFSTTNVTSVVNGRSLMSKNKKKRSTKNVDTSVF